MEEFYRDARRRTGAGRWESPSRGGRRRTRSTRRCAPTSTAGNETATSGLSAATADATEAACLRHTLAEVRDHGWEHHIPRLMILGGYAAQRGWRPADELTDWFHRAFVDGYDWVMVPNVVGMSQHADGGVMATKPYLSGGIYLDRMTDHCGGCRLDPRSRVGEDACPFTAGYWWYLHRNRERLAGNQRMSRALGGLDRMRDLDALVAREDRRGSDPP
jgi:deoxyribodipyrimidine photolyase-related protein